MEHILISFSAGGVCVCVCVCERERERGSDRPFHEPTRRKNTLVPGCQGNNFVTSSFILIGFLLDGLFVLWFNVSIIKTSRHSYNTQMYKPFYSGFCSPAGLFCVCVCVCVSFIWMHLLGSTSSCQYFDLELWPWSVLMKSWSYTPSLQTCAGSFHDISNCLLCIFSAGFWETPL